MNAAAKIVQVDFMPTPKQFSPPTMEEALLHASKVGLPEREAQKFWFFYDSKSWKVGKSPMKQWRSSMALWKLNYQERGGSLTKTVQQAKIPSRDEVYDFSRNKNDTKGYCIKFYDYWSQKNWQQNGRAIDWKVLLCDSLAKQRSA